MKNKPVAWLTLSSLGLGILCVLLTLAGAVGNQTGLLDFRLALNLFRWAVMLGIANALLAIFGLCLSLFQRALRKYPLAAGMGLLLSLLVITPGLMAMSRGKSVPQIHDISTDTNNPPKLEKSLPLRGPGKNSAEYGGPEIARQQHAAYPDIQPWILPLKTTEAFEITLATAHKMGWQIVSENRSRGRIEAVATTFFFGFRDDVVIRLSPQGSEQTRMDIRSVSRVGKSDSGANADRIREYFQQLQLRMP